MLTFNLDLCVEAFDFSEPAHLFLFRAKLVLIAPHSSDRDVLANLLELNVLGVSVRPEPPSSILLELVHKIGLSQVLCLLRTSLTESPPVVFGSDLKTDKLLADIVIVTEEPTDYFDLVKPIVTPDRLNVKGI